MTPRCGKCRYGLVRDRCPMCAGRQIKGVARVVQSTPAQAPNAPVLPPLPLYYTPPSPVRA